MAEDRQRRSTKVCDLALSSVALVPGNKLVVLASWDNSMYVFSVGYGQVLSTVENAHDDAVSAVCLAGGNRVLSGSWDASLKLWQMRESELARQPLMEFTEHEDEIKCVCVAPPDSKPQLAASGAVDGSLCLWDLRQRDCVLSWDAHTEDVSSVMFAPGGEQLLTCSTDGTLTQWDSRMAKELFSMRVGKAPSSLVVDGPLVLLGDEDGSIRCHNRQTQQQVFQVDTGAGPVTCLELSADGSTLVAGHAGNNANVTTWKMSS